METTVTAAPTQGWELLAQLALYGQQPLGQTEPTVLGGFIGEVLERYLGVGGRLTLLADEQELATITWGEAPANGHGFELRDASHLYGRLTLSATFEAGFTAALTTQITTLLAIWYRARINERIEQLRSLGYATLEHIGVGDTNVVLERLCRDACALLPTKALALYWLNFNEQLLVRAVSSAGDTIFPSQLAISENETIVRAITFQTTQHGVWYSRLQRRNTAGEWPLLVDR